MDTRQVLLGVLILAVFATGFMVGRFSGAGDTIVSGNGSVPAEGTSDNEAATTVVGSSGVEEDTTIATTNLTDGQRAVLSAVGIDADSVVVTPEMAACADASLGADRMGEIINGDTPSLTEGIKLVACYK